MSNNPFLKPKEPSKLTNNRFSALQDDIKSSFKESSNKKIIKYNSSQNSFSKFSNSYEQTKINTQTENINSNDLNLFPELVKINETNISILETPNKPISFKHILNNVDENAEPRLENTIPEGWVKLSFNNRKTLIEYGPSTMSVHQPKTELKQEKFEQNEEDPNYIMFNAIEAMKKSWDKYKLEYDDLHGEGAYVERFCSSPVYGSEYDSESEYEYEDEDEEIVN